MLLSITTALMDYLNGVRITDEQVEKRLSICNSCVHKAELVVDFCSECKCVISLKTKALREKCPKGKWIE